MKKKIDMSALAPADKQFLRGVLSSSEIPDGVKRFCTAALFPQDPELAELAKGIHDAEATENYFFARGMELVRDVSLANAGGAPMPTSEWDFNAWLLTMAKEHVELLPDGAMKQTLIGRLEEHRAEIRKYN